MESYFNDLKSRTCKEVNLPIRVDNFFKIHHNAISAMMKLAAATNKEHQDEIKFKIEGKLESIK